MADRLETSRDEVALSNGAARRLQRAVRRKSAVRAAVVPPPQPPPTTPAAAPPPAAKTPVVIGLDIVNDMLNDDNIASFEGAPKRTTLVWGEAEKTPPAAHDDASSSKKKSPLDVLGAQFRWLRDAGDRTPMSAGSSVPDTPEEKENAPYFASRPAPGSKPKALGHSASLRGLGLRANNDGHTTMLGVVPGGLTYTTKGGLRRRSSSRVFG